MTHPKNIVFIMTDQQHYRTLGCHGVAEAKTPNIDALAKKGLMFKNHIVANPVCSPSRASIITGSLPGQHGLWGNGCSLDESATTIPKGMGQAGYQTAHFGKLHLVPILDRTEEHADYGFDVCEVSEGDQNLFEDCHFKWLRKHNPDVFLQYINEMFQNGHGNGYTSEIPEELHMSSYVTERSVDWINNRRDDEKPFYLSVGYFDPHHAFNPCEPYASDFAEADIPDPVFHPDSMATRPEHYRKRYEGMKNTTDNVDGIRKTLRAYHAMVAHLDVCVGRIVSTLEQAGLADDTLVVFTSDHGEMMGNHRLLWKGPQLLDDVLRVPCVMAIPGKDLGGKTVDAVTSSIDFFPTFTHVAGAKDAVALDGVPMVDGDLNPLPEGEREYALVEWEDNVDTETASLRCLRTKDWKLVHYGNAEEGELYDLANDPDEFFNRYHDPEYAESRDRLVSKLANHYLSRRPLVPQTCKW